MSCCLHRDLERAVRCGGDALELGVMAGPPAQAQEGSAELDQLGDADAPEPRDRMARVRYQQHAFA
jgi:hypothetical protein